MFDKEGKYLHVRESTGDRSWKNFPLVSCLTSDQSDKHIVLAGCSAFACQVQHRSFCDDSAFAVTSHGHLVISWEDCCLLCQRNSNCEMFTFGSGECQFLRKLHPDEQNQNQGTTFTPTRHNSQYYLMRGTPYRLANSCSTAGEDGPHLCMSCTTSCKYILSQNVWLFQKKEEEKKLQSVPGLCKLKWGGGVLWSDDIVARSLWNPWSPDCHGWGLVQEEGGGVLVLSYFFFDNFLFKNGFGNMLVIKTSFCCADKVFQTFIGHLQEIYLSQLLAHVSPTMVCACNRDTHTFWKVRTAFLWKDSKHTNQ